jgi:FkbM family methyltransferase
VRFYRHRLQRDFSEAGETVAVRRIMRRFPERSFVEIGANDGVTTSTTFGLVRDGWQGLCVEPNPRIYAKLVENLRAWPSVRTVACAVGTSEGPAKLFLGKDDPRGMVSTLATDDSEWFRQHRSEEFVEVDCRRLATLLENEGVAGRFGLLMVDAEGMDLEVLQSADFSRARPRLIVTEEYEPKAAAKHELLRSLGYELRERIGANTFWLDTQV